MPGRGAPPPCRDLTGLELGWLLQLCLLVSVSQGCFKAGGGSSPGSAVPTGAVTTPAWFWELHQPHPARGEGCTFRGLLFCCPLPHEFTGGSVPNETSYRQPLRPHRGKGQKPLVPRRHKVKLGVAGGTAPSPLLLGQEIPTQAKPSL